MKAKGKKRRAPLSRLALDGIGQALTHSETMMACDEDTFTKEDWREHEAAVRWFNGVLAQRGLRRGDT